VLLYWIDLLNLYFYSRILRRAQHYRLVYDFLLCQRNQTAHVGRIGSYVTSLNMHSLLIYSCDRGLLCAHEGVHPPRTDRVASLVYQAAYLSKEHS
jgi:hypothetical protein